ncbi:MAG: hypothetical protein AAGC60_03535 [Acidobacteriota bacterium]
MQAHVLPLRLDPEEVLNAQIAGATAGTERHRQTSEVSFLRRSAAFDGVEKCKLTNRAQAESFAQGLEAFAGGSVDRSSQYLLKLKLVLRIP